MQQALAGEQGQEGVGDGGAVAGARVELAGEHVEGLRVLAEEGQVEDGFGLGQVERREVGVEACGGGAEVGDWRRRGVLVSSGVGGWCGEWGMRKKGNENGKFSSLFPFLILGRGFKQRVTYCLLQWRCRRRS